MYIPTYAYVRAMCGWLDVLRSFFLFLSYLFLSFLLDERTEGAYKFARSRLRFVLLWVFVSSGTDCRVRRRMHAPFPGPYVSTLALNFNRILHLSCFLPTLLQSSSFSHSLSLSVLNASARYSRGLSHTCHHMECYLCPLTKDKPMSVTRIHKFLFAYLSIHI